jgi:DNA excision repair protein ERCC-2
VVPGNIRKAEHFIGLMRRLIEFMKAKLKTTTVLTESTLSFLQSLYTQTAIEAKSLRFCSTRLSSLFHSLQMSDIAEFNSISLVADFATLVGTYSKGFTIITDPFHTEWNEAFGDGPRQDNNPIIQFCCLDASLAMKPVIAKYRSVVITSGTLSPLDIYPRMLDFVPVLTERFPMTLTRACVCPLIVTRGSDQVAVSSKYELRNDPAVIRNFGNILVEMSSVVPDGVVCFFTSYSYMEQIVSLWHEMGVLKNVLANKLLFVETPDPVETAIAMENYKKACNNGRGAVLFSVARGKVSEGIDFDNQYGRCVIMFGIPFVNTESRVLKARLEFLRTNHQIKESEFLSFDAMRNTAQCVGRVIRGKNDYGIMVFVDKRYNRMDKRNKLPQWISDAMQPSHLNLSTDMAVGVAKKFLKEMAQPWAKEDQIGKSLWTLEHIENLQSKQNKAPQN